MPTPILDGRMTYSNLAEFGAATIAGLGAGEVDAVCVPMLDDAWLADVTGAEVAA